MADSDQPVSAVYVALMTRDDGTEGMVSVVIPGTETWLPLAATTLQLMEDLAEPIQSMADRLGREIRIAMFDTRTPLRTVRPAACKAGN